MIKSSTWRALAPSSGGASNRSAGCVLYEKLDHALAVAIKNTSFSARTVAFIIDPTNARLGHARRSRLSFFQTTQTCSSST